MTPNGIRGGLKVWLAPVVGLLDPATHHSSSFPSSGTENHLRTLYISKKPSNMRLEQLPIDILKGVFVLLSVEDLEALIGTNGNMRRILLAPGAVTRLAISPRPGARIPKLAYQLPFVTSVSIYHHCRSYHHKLHMLAPVLFGFPILVTTLCIDAWYFHEQAIGYAPSNTPYGAGNSKCCLIISKAFPNLQTLDVVSAYDSQPDVLKSFTNLPPTLTSLSVKFPAHLASTYVEFPDISGLVNLTHLQLSPFLRTTGQTGFDGTLYPNLTSLSLPFFVGPVSISENHIIHLGISQSNESIFTPALQRRCERVTLFLNKFDLDCSDLRLSTHIVHIDVATIPSFRPFVLSAPKSLTSLKIGRILGQEPNDDILLLQLPDGLKTLDYPSSASLLRQPNPSLHVATSLLSAAEKENKKFLPSLTNFYYSNEVSPMSVEWLKLLPSSLRMISKTLSLDVTRPELIDFAQKLPLLKNLSLASQSSESHLPAEMSHTTEAGIQADGIQPKLHLCKQFTLPSMLQTLTVVVAFPRGSSSGLSSDKDALHAQSILDSYPERFPETLESIRIVEPCFPLSFQRLPTGLKVFRGEFRSHPKMKITQKHGIVTSWGRVPEYFEVALQTLPPTLHTLYLQSNALIGDTKAFLSALPRTLTELNVPSLEKFGDEEAPFLPPNLAIMDIRHSETLTNAGFMLLPRTLVSVGLKLNRGLTPKIFDNNNFHSEWPRLASLEIPRNTNFPKALRTELFNAISHMPRFSWSVRTRKLKC